MKRMPLDALSVRRSIEKDREMINIDAMMDMISWNNPQEILEKGILLAKDVKCINAFLQPKCPGHSKVLHKAR